MSPPPLLLSSRHHGISQPLLGERMLLVALIKSKWFHEGIWWSSTSRAMCPLGRAPTHRAICQRKPPSPSHQPAADINYELTATTVPPALPVWRWEGLRGATGKLQMLLAHSYGRHWARLLLYSDLFAAGVLVKAEPLEDWAESLHAINHSCPQWSCSMCSAKNSSVLTPIMYPCNTAYSTL